MRIAQVSVYFYPQMVGGLEWYVYNISRRLASLGHEVDVLTTENCGNGNKLEPIEEFDGVRIHRLPLSLDLSYRLKVWHGLKERLLEGHYDIIHTYDYAQPHTFTALNVGKTLGIPVILTVFDVHSLIPRRFWKNFFIRFFERFAAPIALRKATTILVRAPNIIPPILSMGAQPEKVRVTPSGVLDEALNHFDGQEFLERYRISGKPIILYIGRLNPMKGPQHLVMAAPCVIKEYPEARFVFVGQEQGGFKNQLTELSRKLQVSEHIYFTGPIYDFHEKMNAYASCDIFALPSGYEGTSQAIFEAMSQAKPIVATNRGGIPSQVEDGKEGLLVEYGDVEALGDAVLMLLKEPKEAILMGLNGREKVKHYTYSVLTQQMECIYRDVLNST